MKEIILDHYRNELALFQKATDAEKRWEHLARAHILSQYYAWPHLYIHWKMFLYAVQTLNHRELLGQIPRLILAIPGSLSKKAPKGNTGLSNIGIFTPMEIPEDLKEILK